MDFLSSLFKIYFNNKDALDFIHEKVTFSQVFFTGWALTIFISLIGSFVPQETEVIEFLNAYGLSIFLVNMISSILIYPIVVFILYGIIHLLLHLFGGKAKYLETLKFMIALTIVPLIYNLILTFLSFIPQNIQLVFSILTAIVSIVMFVWGIVLFVQIFSVIHSISILRTFLVGFLLPFALIIIIIVLVTFIYVAVIFQTASSLQAKSLDVGRDYQGEAPTNIEVVQVYAADTSDGSINATDSMTMIVRLGSGSSPINLNDLIVKMDTQSGSQTLRQIDGAATTLLYNVSYVSNGGLPATPGYLVTGDLAQITFLSRNIIGGGETATIRLLTNNGAVKPVDMTTPSVMTETTTYLFP